MTTYSVMEWARTVDLPAAQKALLFALASRADASGCCFPSQARLAKEAGMGERSVRRHLAAFEEAGLIERRARMRGEGRGRTSDTIRLLYRPTGQLGRKDSDQPANYDDQPANGCTTNRPLVAGELPEKNQIERAGFGDSKNRAVAALGLAAARSREAVGREAS